MKSTETVMHEKGTSITYGEWDHRTWYAIDRTGRGRWGTKREIEADVTHFRIYGELPRSRRGNTL